MKIIDFDIKGNQVKFYLGNSNCNDYWGDDWNDKPYESSAGTVYNRFIRGIKIVTFDFDDIVVEPSDDYSEVYFSKEDMKNRKIPCICVLKKEFVDDDMYDVTFRKIVGNKNVISFYFGDEMEPDTIFEPPIEKEYIHIHLESPTKAEFKLLEVTSKSIGSAINAMLTDEEKSSDVYDKNKKTNLKKYFNNLLKQTQKMYFNENTDVDIISRIIFEIVDEEKYHSLLYKCYSSEDLFITVKSNDIYDIGVVQKARGYKH